MIQLHFKVDPVYVVYYLLINCAPDRFIKGVPRQRVIDFENIAWARDKDAYGFLRWGISEDSIIEHKSSADLAGRADQLLKDMVAHPSYKSLERETMEALDKVRKEWEEDYPKSSTIMQELTGLSLDKTFEVYMTHPSQKNGSSGARIRWTYRQDFPHYNTVYLWHEILHTYIPTKSRKLNNVEHSVIELLSDNELRVRFNDGTYPPFLGHSGDRPIQSKLLPSWREYLKQPDKDIRKYLAKAHEIVPEAAVDEQHAEDLGI